MNCHRGILLRVGHDRACPQGLCPFGWTSGSIGLTSGHDRENLVIQINTTELLADLAQTVLDDPRPDQFLAHIVNKTLASIDARAAIMGLIEREGFLDLQGSYGYSNSMVEPYMRIPLWTPMPITDAARTGQITIFQSPSEVIKKYPHLSEIDSGDIGVTVSAPIRHRNTTIGAIGFTALKTPQPNFENSVTTQGVLALCGLYMRNLIASKVSQNKDYSGSVKSLTARQKQIIQLFKDDLTTDQMAERLKYSSSTIKQDIIKIYSLFGVNSRIAVVQLADRAGLF
jgi:DNA-binding CsgD family transcriptional regulator